MSRLLKVLRLLFAAFFRCLVLVSSDVRSTARAARRLAKPRPVFHDRGAMGLGGKDGVFGARSRRALWRLLANLRAPAHVCSFQPPNTTPQPFRDQLSFVPLRRSESFPAFVVFFRRVLLERARRLPASCIGVRDAFAERLPLDAQFSSTWMLLGPARTRNNEIDPHAMRPQRKPFSCAIHGHKACHSVGP